MATLLVEKGLCGGQVLTADLVENFPGFPAGIQGIELMEKMTAHAKKNGLEVKAAEAVKLIVEKGLFKVIIDTKEELSAVSIIVATGAHWRPMGVPGEEEFRGRGVSYCATCDGPLFKGKEVVVIGGGDTAVGEALFLTKFAKKVTIVHRRDKLRAAQILRERVLSNKTIEVRWNSVVTKISGKATIEKVTLKDVHTGRESELPCSGVFVLIGISPNSELVKGIVDVDEDGYIVTDEDMKTSAEGIFACGDIRKKSLRQIVAACGEGAAAAFSAERYVERVK